MASCSWDHGGDDFGRIVSAIIPLYVRKSIMEKATGNGNQEREMVGR